MGNRELRKAMIEILEIELQTVKMLGQVLGEHAVRKTAAMEREQVLSQEIFSLRCELEEDDFQKF